MRAASDPTLDKRTQLRIEVHVGYVKRRSVLLTPGQVLEPLSIGSRADFCVDAADVAPVHGYIYYDGATLFLRSASSNTPVLVDGSPVPQEWMTVCPPCEIKLGLACLWLRAVASPEDQTLVMSKGQAEAARRAMPQARGETEAAFSSGTPQQSPAAPTPVRDWSSITAATRVVPIETILASRKRAPPPVAASDLGAVVPTSEAPAPPPISVNAPSPQVAVPQEPQVAVPQKQSWVKAKWREATRIKKVLVILSLPLTAAVWKIFEPPNPLPPSEDKSVSLGAFAGAQSVAPSSAPPPTALNSASTPHVSSSAVPSASASASASAALAGESAFVRGNKTPERQAVDAVVVGDNEHALKFYEELAVVHPGVPAYAEAARILRAKIGKAP